jgi:multiple sugar transport system substrate-binding protein
VEIVFSAGADGTGTVRRMVDAFNEVHRGEIRVEWREMSPENDVHRRALLDALDAEPGGIDVLASDVVWTAELAHGGYVQDVTDRFYDDYDRETFLPAPLGSATYRLRIWGVPWYTDAGLLFYRSDLLALSGITAPPATWEELGETALRVMAESETPYGFVFQGADYEGGAANAAEFIWSAGGDVMTSRLAVTGVVVNTAMEVDRVAVGSDEAARGLDIARGLIEDGVAPAAVADFREAESLEAFAAGEAVYLRSWPYAYRALLRAGLTEDQVGLAPLPAAGAAGESASALGGWNLMVNARSSEAERRAAWTLIRYLTDPEQQRRQAVEAGLLPVLEGLYDDPGLSAEVPVIGVGKALFADRLHERPMTPFYGALSASISSAFHRLLRGELNGGEAAALLEDELRAIVARNR